MASSDDAARAARRADSQAYRRPGERAVWQSGGLAVRQSSKLASEQEGLAREDLLEENTCCMESFIVSLVAHAH